MKSEIPLSRRTAGFSLSEVLIAMTIVVVVVGGALAVFIGGLRTMYRDNQRLATNATLRNFIAHVSKETLDSTEFYVFPNYQSLDGHVDLTDDVATLQPDAFGTYLAHGDCLVLVTRVSTEDLTSNVRRFCIYYRVTTSPNTIAPVRYYERDYGPGGTPAPLAALLTSVNLKTTPAVASSRQLVASARGRLISGSTTNCYPIFSTESATATPTNDSVSINVEVINGTTTNNMLSSSSFNYTISPRK